MTFGALLSDLYRRLDFASTPATEVSTRLKAFVNETLQELISEPGLAAWIARNEPLVTFASVASRAVYAIPAGVDRVDAITDWTSDRRLTAMSLDVYRTVLPDPASITGTPTDYVPFGFQAVAVQPSAATGLWAVSTSASDTTQTVSVETVRTGGLPYSASLTVNGVTRVQLGTSTDHEQVTKFYLSAAAVGDIRLYDAAAAGNLLATIPIGQTFSRYYSFALYPTPATAITYYLDSERPVTDLVNATDEPPIPPRFHQLLIQGALLREFTKRDDTRAATAERQYTQGVSRLRYFVTCPPDFLPVSGSGRIELPSRLGGSYPSGSGYR